MSTEYVVHNPTPDNPVRVAVDEQSGRFSIDFECDAYAHNEGHVAVWGTPVGTEDDIGLSFAITETKFTPEALVDIAMRLLIAASYHIEDTCTIVDAFETTRKKNHWPNVSQTPPIAPAMGNPLASLEPE